MKDVYELIWRCTLRFDGIFDYPDEIAIANGFDISQLNLYGKRTKFDFWALLSLATRLIPGFIQVYYSSRDYTRQIAYFHF